MPGKSLLIVEDDPRSLYAFQAVLRARGFHVVGCNSAESAMNHDGMHFDAAIIDVRLPKMQGTQLAQQLREKKPNIRIVMITAYDGLEAIKAVLPDTAVLLKPIDMENLLRLL